MQTDRQKKASLGLRFSLMVGVILLLFSAVFSMVIYMYLRNQVIREAENKTKIIMTNVTALGGYVRDTLRPKIAELLTAADKKNEFVVEAMSTTHINLEVMKRFSKNLPDYIYKRVSDRPLNPENRADEFHAGLQHYFEKNRGERSWRGIVPIDDREHLVMAVPVISDESCLACHGSRIHAPRSLLLKYGGRSQFGWVKDQIAGVETVSIPLDIAFAGVKKAALDTFTFGMVALILLFAALYMIFQSLVSRPLNRLSHVFHRIAGGSEPLGREIPVARKDEIGYVTESFNVLSRHLLLAQEELKKKAEIEKHLMEMEKLATLGQLSAGVAHEINNPLGGMKLCFNNLIQIEMPEHKREEHIAVINSGFDRIHTIVKNLLDFSKNSELSIAPASLNRIVAEVLNLAEYTISRKNINVTKDFRAGVADLPVDSNKLEQVILNLIMNAVYAVDEGGTITVRTWCDQVFCGFSIGDTGRGISSDVLPKIFDPFFSTKSVGEGTGLGLTVSKAIVEQHGGEIIVKTSENGTVFMVKLPRERA